MRGVLHHVEIYVSDLKRSKIFWSWLLEKFDYKCVATWDQGVSYQLGSTYLVFVQTEKEYLEPSYHRKRTGLNHLAFWADSRAEVDQITEELRQKDVSILYEDLHPFAGGKDYYAVFFEDPDRIKVEIVAPHLNK